jgi:putative methyltransferase
VEDLLALPSNLDLHADSLLEEGAIILQVLSSPILSLSHTLEQDKASCLPSFILHPPLNSNVIDACSAPGLLDICKLLMIAN